MTTNREVRRSGSFDKACLMFSFQVLLGFLLAGVNAAVDAAEPMRTRPNIVWIVVEDMSAHFSCYGERAIATPEVDRLAREGLRFERAFVTAPICSTSRSAMITGRYQTSIGAHHHRSGRGEVKIHLPEGVEPIPALFQRAGYFTVNGAWPLNPRESAEGAWKKMTVGKTDYNFEWNKAIYGGADWAARKQDQPFFAQIQLHGGKHRDGAKWRERAKQWLPQLTDPAAISLPPYYPRTPGILEDWAAYLDAVRFTDLQVGQIRQRLTDEGLLDNTVIFFLTDHGISHARGKQFLYDEGIRVPLVVRGPGIASGKIRGELVEHIDLAATSLTLAGIPLPAGIQGRDFLSNQGAPRDAIFAARDRADETIDHLRCVRTERFKYVRNFLPERAHLQPNAYKDHKPCLIALRQARQEGLLDEVQKVLFAPSRPAEELYDLAADPWEINNLALDPAHQETLKQLRARWIAGCPRRMTAGATRNRPLNLRAIWRST
jgi:arylsulfatase A-like enzyme